VGSGTAGKSSEPDVSAVIFDTEATDLESPQVIEAAWLLIRDPNSIKPDERFHQRYRPGKRISLGALATHHIMDEDLVDCPPYTDFRLPTGIEYLVGYNIDYDWKVIGQPNIRRICVMALSRHIYPGLDSYSQSAILYHLERGRARDLLKNAHSALQDVENCWLILQRILFHLGADSGSWEAIWRRSELARIPTVMAFGKHKGMAIKDVPADYKRWLLGQPELDPYLIKALRGEAP
jgi:exodeoxyribonuclease X